MREEKFYEELSPYVERAKQGDQDAFEHLYQATYDMTKWFVLNFCKDKNEAGRHYTGNIFGCLPLSAGFEK